MYYSLFTEASFNHAKNYPIITRRVTLSLFIFQAKITLFFLIFSMLFAHFTQYYPNFCRSKAKKKSMSARNWTKRKNCKPKRKLIIILVARVWKWCWKRSILDIWPYFTINHGAAGFHEKWRNFYDVSHCFSSDKAGKK